MAARKKAHLATFVNASDSELRALKIVRKRAGSLRVETGKLIACDTVTGARAPFARRAPLGEFEVELLVDREGRGVPGLAIVRFRDEAIVRSERAETTKTPRGKGRPGFPVDGGEAVLFDAKGVDAYASLKPLGNAAVREQKLEGSTLTAVSFSTWGDGFFTAYWGFDGRGRVAALYIDTQLFTEPEAPKSRASAASLVAKAKSLLEARRMDDALAHVTKAFAAAPADPAVLDVAAGVLRKWSHLERDSAALERLFPAVYAASRPDDVRLKDAYASFLNEKKKWPDLERVARDAIASGSTHLGTRCALAEALLALDRAEDALEVGEALKFPVAWRYSIYNELARAASRLGRFGLALEHMKLAVSAFEASNRAKKLPAALKHNLALLERSQGAAHEQMKRVR